MGSELDAEKLEAAMKKKDGGSELEMDDRKRKYNSLKANDTEVTPEEMEAWRMKKSRADDPMLNMSQSGTQGYDIL